MSNGIESLGDYARFYCDPKIWQQAVSKLPDNSKLALPTVAGIDFDLMQLQEDIGG